MGDLTDVVFYIFQVSVSIVTATTKTMSYTCLSNITHRWDRFLYQQVQNNPSVALLVTLTHLMAGLIVFLALIL